MDLPAPAIFSPSALEGAAGMGRFGTLSPFWKLNAGAPRGRFSLDLLGARLVSRADDGRVVEVLICYEPVNFSC